MNVTKILVSKIVPDANQPRKYFDEAKMGTLKASIKVRGIKQPLVLETRKDGTFLIIEGERRFRVAKELGMKEVPALLEPEQNEVQRLIEQFHLQEQHEGWSSVEKAVAISRLAESMNASYEEIGKLIGINNTQVGDYMAFSKIIDKKNFERSRVTLRTARNITRIRNYAEKISTDSEIEFDRNDAKKLEGALLKRIGDEGTGETMSMFRKVQASFKQSPAIIKKFIEDDTLTVDKMFKDSKGRGALQLSSIMSNASWLAMNIDHFLKEKTVKVSDENVKMAKRGLEALKKFINEFDR